MSRCRCYDIEVVKGDLRKLVETGEAVQAMRSALSQTDQAMYSLKTAIEAAADVSLGGVADDAFSRDGREVLSAAESAISSRMSTLKEKLASYESEDARYHEQA